MSILSTNHRLISIGESYSAGNGIDITDQVISVTGDATPYSAGDNIDIQGHVISGKDWTQDITDASSNAYNETTAWVHDNYANSADVSYLSGVVDNKLDTSAWSSVSSNFATEDYVIMADNITYDRTTGYVENQQFAKESACQSAFEQLNTNKLDASSFTDWQNGQYSTDLQTIEGQIANKLDTSSFSEVSGDFQPRGDYVERNTVYSAIESATSSKLDVSSFASVSSDFLTTAFGISESATWNDVSETVQTNSASWADGGTGDEEVNSFVYNNSATINEVNTAYQQYSASYQPSGNYIPYTGYDAVKGYSTNSSFTIQDGTFTNSLGRGTILIQNRITSNIYTKLAAGPTNISFITPSDSAQVDLSSINKWNEVSTTVQSNSAQWAEGGGNVPVSNSGDLYKVEFDGVDLYGYKSTSSTPNFVYSSVSSQESNYIQYTTSPQWNNNAIQDLQNWSAFDIISISSNGNGIRPVHYPDGITALDVYYQAKYVFDYNNNQLTDFSGYVGQITLDNLFVSSYFDKPSYFNDIKRVDQFRLWFSGNDYEGQLSNNHYICSVDNKVQSGTNTISGIFVPSAIDTSNYIPYTTSGLELPNSHFKIDASGQAYKLAIVNSAEQPLDNSFFQADNTLSYPFGKGKHYIVNVPSSRKTFNVRSVSPYAIICSGIVQNGVCDFVYPSSGVTGYKRFYTYNDYGTAPLTTANCKLYYFKTSPSGEYVLKSELPTYEYDSTNKISAINGSAIAAGGGEVPTGTMNVSGLEYNAVNEISAYNGSAIAQYGAEKQWLVHDDTIVHVANSAQYAFGCNVSALQRLMGIDETVLYSGSYLAKTNNTATISEPITNFETIKIYASRDNTTRSPKATEFQVISATSSPYSIENTFYNSSGEFYSDRAQLKFNNTTVICNIDVRVRFNATGYSLLNNTPLTVTKIVGIGRKA